jgi:hypothetical protein
MAGEYVGSVVGKKMRLEGTTKYTDLLPEGRAQRYKKPSFNLIRTSRTFNYGVRYYISSPAGPVIKT